MDVQNLYPHTNIDRLRYKNEEILGKVKAQIFILFFYFFCVQ